MIRETLLYKFRAQSFTYDDFQTDIAESGYKQFPLNEVMKMLSDEPFLLGDGASQKVICYLFERSSFQGNEVI